MREKLIDLLDETFEKQYDKNLVITARSTANFLIANGVTIPVQCEDCAVPHNRFTGCPKLNGLIPPQDFFCAYGERKIIYEVKSDA